MREKVSAEKAAKILKGWRKSRGKDGRFAVAHGLLHNVIDPEHRKHCHHCRVMKWKKPKR